jgi:hypothetical protein
MKGSDRMLVGIVSGIVLLVVAALVLTLTRPPAEYQPEDSPAGVVHNYLLALQDEDYERAYRYLASSLKCRPSSAAELSDDVRRNSYLFGSPSEGRSWAVEDTTQRGTRATVEVAETRFRQRGLFESGQTFSRFEVALVLEEDGWRIVEADRYFNRWSWSSDNCSER